MITKKRKLANAKVDSNKAYSLKEASSLVKEINTTKFDSSVDLHIKLGLILRKLIRLYAALFHCHMVLVKPRRC